MDNWSGTYTKVNAPDISATAYPGVTAIGKSYQNYFAVEICFGLFLPLLFVQMLRNTFPPTPERQKSLLFNIWNITSSLLAFVALIISAHIAWDIKNNQDYPNGSQDKYYQYSLKVVGTIPSGLDFFHAPKLKWDFGKLLIDGWCYS